MITSKLAPAEAVRTDSPERLTLIRSMLRTELTTTLALAETCRSTVAELTGEFDIDSVMDREIAEASATRADQAVADIHWALDRLANGTYGTCDLCEDQIPQERLDAIPYARWCVPCSRLRS